MEDKRTGAPAFTIAKTEPDKMLVFGWGSVAVDADGTQIEDLQGDMIDPEDLEKAAYDHVLNFRSTGERHDPRLRRKGRLVESCVFTKEKQAAIGIPPGTVPEGWWVGYKIDDPEAWEKIKSGEYQSFSVEGKGERTPIKKAHVAKSYAQMRKFNPYHDTKGRFASKPGGSGEAAQEFMMNRITLRDIANMKTIKSIIEDNEFTHYGFRMQEEDTEKIGQEMQHLSSNWGGDFDDPYKGPIIEEIAGELDGVSTIGIQAIGEVTDIGGYSGTVVYFVGSNKWPGTGYDPGEFIMKEPTVLAKIGMKNGKLTVLDHVEIEGNQSNQRESRRSDPPKKVENPGYTAFMSQMEAKYGRDKMWESMDDDEFDRAQWWESRRYDSVAKSYDEVRKFNPYHDRLGRFSTANGAVSFTYAPGKSRAHDLAIQRMKRKYQRENSALTKVDKPVHLEATLRLGHNTMSGTTYRTQSVIQAAEAAPFTGNLTLSYATPTKTTRRNNGNIDYEYELHHGLYQDSNRSGISSSIGIDWDKVQTVGGQTYESREFLRGKGFRWDPQKKIYTKNPAAGRQSSVSSGKLTIVGNDFPSDLSGVTRISGNTYPHRAQIKAAGFKWDPNSKEWVKPQVSKSAELWDDEPMRAIGYAEVRKFNPYHDARGRFTSRGAHTTFSPGSDQNQARRSIDAENARRQAEGMDQLVGGAYMTIGKVEYGSALKAYLEEQAKKKDPIQQTAAPAKAGKKVDWASMTDDEFAKNLETYMPGITDIATKGWAATHDRYQYADSGLNGDMVLTDIYKARGYNALPQMMDKSAVKAYIAQNKTPELYRGMGTSSHGQSGAEKMDRFQSDPLHFAGYGVLGNGTYAAQTLPNSARNFGLRVARSYSRRGGNGTQVRMTLQKGTKTASYSTVRGQQHAFLSKLWSARYSGSIDNGLANTIQNICSDVGRFGALRGYEAWYDRGAHSGANKNNPFWVITNRGALIIQNERYS